MSFNFINYFYFIRRLWPIFIIISSSRYCLRSILYIIIFIGYSLRFCVLIYALSIYFFIASFSFFFAPSYYYYSIAIFFIYFSMFNFFKNNSFLKSLIFFKSLIIFFKKKFYIHFFKIIN